MPRISRGKELLRDGNIVVLQNLSPAVDSPNPRVTIHENGTVSLVEELCDVGIHQGVFFSIGRMDRMVAAFRELQNDIAVPIMLGHDEAAMLERAGAPACGWVTQLWRDGRKLNGLLEFVPYQVYQLIERRAYRAKSIGFAFDFQDKTGRTYSDILLHLAFLGEECPEVRTIDEIQNLYSMPDYLRGVAKTTPDEYKRIFAFSTRKLSTSAAKIHTGKATHKKRGTIILKPTIDDLAKRVDALGAQFSAFMKRFDAAPAPAAAFAPPVAPAPAPADPAEPIAPPPAESDIPEPVGGDADVGNMALEISDLFAQLSDELAKDLEGMDETAAADYAAAVNSILEKINELYLYIHPAITGLPLQEGLAKAAAEMDEAEDEEPEAPMAADPAVPAPAPAATQAAAVPPAPVPGAVLKSRRPALARKFAEGDPLPAAEPPAAPPAPAEPVAPPAEPPAEGAAAADEAQPASDRDADLSAIVDAVKQMRDLKAERAAKYGIAVLPATPGMGPMGWAGPDGAPLDPEVFADPVNLRYPLRDEFDWSFGFEIFKAIESALYDEASRAAIEKRFLDAAAGLKVDGEAKAKEIDAAVKAQALSAEIREAAEIAKANFGASYAVFRSFSSRAAKPAARGAVDPMVAEMAAEMGVNLEAHKTFLADAMRTGRMTGREADVALKNILPNLKGADLAAFKSSITGRTPAAGSDVAGREATFAAGATLSDPVADMRPASPAQSVDVRTDAKRIVEKFYNNSRRRPASGNEGRK